jgi:hypothetical protein
LLEIVQGLGGCCSLIPQRQLIFQFGLNHSNVESEGKRTRGKRGGRESVCGKMPDIMYSYSWILIDHPILSGLLNIKSDSPLYRIRTTVSLHFNVNPSQDKTRQDKTRQDRTGQDKTGQVRTGQVRTGQVRTGQDRTGQDRTGQVRTGQDRTGQVRTGQDRTGQVRIEQDRSGQDRTGQDRTGQDRTK